MTRIKLNDAALEAVAKSRPIRAMVEAAAEKVAAQVRAQGIGVGDQDGGSHEVPLPVKVTVYETDRARASVVLAHPAGLAVQAKHGALTRAAAAAGLEVKGD